MLAQRLVRRALHSQTCARDAQFLLVDGARASFIPSRHITQSRQVQTQQVSRRPPPSPKYRLPKGSVNQTELAPASTSSEDDSRIIRLSKALLLDHDHVLLYKSPRHGSLMTTSMVFGSSQILAAASMWTGFINNGPFSMYLVVPASIAGALCCIFGTHMLMTTLKSIDRVYLVRTADDEFKLRFHSKWSAYFWQPRVQEVSLDNVFFDRELHVEGGKIHFHNVALEDRFTWTEAVDRNPQWRSDDGRPWKDRMKDFFTQLRRDVGRSAARNGMFRIKIGKTVWRADTYKADSLLEGKALAGLFQDDPDTKSTMAIVRRYFMGF